MIKLNNSKQEKVFPDYCDVFKIYSQAVMPIDPRSLTISVGVRCMFHEILNAKQTFARLVHAIAALSK